MNWSTIFRLMLIVDSVLFLFKLGIAAWLIVGLVEETVQWNGRLEHTDSDGIHFWIYVPWYPGIILLIIFVILRWFTNFKQYRNENRNSDENFSGNVGWFISGALNMVSNIVVISANLCSLTSNLDLHWMCEYPRFVAAGLLVYETFMFAFMALYKIKS